MFHRLTCKKKTKQNKTKNIHFSWKPTTSLLIMLEKAKRDVCAAHARWDISDNNSSDLSPRRHKRTSVNVNNATLTPHWSLREAERGGWAQTEDSRAKRHWQKVCFDSFRLWRLQQTQIPDRCTNNRSPEIWSTLSDKKKREKMPAHHSLLLQEWEVIPQSHSKCSTLYV